jgi:hypothetical protein
MRFARVEEDKVAEIIDLPEGIELIDAFHGSIISALVPCSGDVEAGWSYREGAFSPPAPQGFDLELCKSQMKSSVDASAEIERLKYITPGAGQAMTYAQKAEEARLCLDASGPGPEDYPLLAAEIGITASTLVGVAQVVADANAQWLQIGAAIEAARLSAKKAITEATTVEEAQAAAQSVVWP